MEVLKNLLDMLYSSKNGMMYFYIVSAVIALILVILIIVTLVSGNKEAKQEEVKEEPKEEKESVITQNEVLPKEEVLGAEIPTNIDNVIPEIEVPIVEPIIENVNESVKEEPIVVEEEFKLEDQIINPEINSNIFQNSTYFEEKTEVEEFELPKPKEGNVSNDLFLERLNALKEKK